MAKYRIVRYAADGCAGEPNNGAGADGATIATSPTLRGARAEVRRIMEVRTLSGRRWSGGDESIEAYHDHPTRYGCGGYSIDRADAHERRAAARRDERERREARADYDVE